MDEYRQNTVIIEEELNEGQRIAIFPIGKKGLELKLILEQRYGHTGIYVDNYMSKYNRNIIDFNKYIEIDKDSNTIILCFGKQSEEWKNKLLDAGVRAKIVYWNSYPNRYYNSFDKEYIEIKRLCAVKSVQGINLMRTGNDCDGGYVILDDLDNIENVYSFGIGSNVSWEEDISSRCHDVFCYDPTIDTFPSTNSRLHFSKLGISGTNEGDYLTMDAIIRNNGHEECNNLFLKMDVEGYEWDFIEQVDISTLMQFKQMVFEFHELDKSCCKRIIKCLEKINQTHQAVWIHGNNSGGVAVSNSAVIPRLMEITYVRKDDYTFDDISYNCPTKLDFPNLLDRDEIELTGWGSLDF